MTASRIPAPPSPGAPPLAPVALPTPPLASAPTVPALPGLATVDLDPAQLRTHLTGGGAAAAVGHQSRAAGTRLTASAVARQLDVGVVATAQRLLGSGEPIDAAALGALLTAVDQLDPAAQLAQLRTLRRSQPELAEALLLFRAAGPGEQTAASRRERTGAALEHLTINTDASVEVAGPTAKVMQQAAHYAAASGVSGLVRHGEQILATVGGQRVELLRFDPALSPADQLAAIGQAVNARVHEAPTALPLARIPFAPDAAGYSAQDAHWGARLSQLAYVEPAIAEAQARVWGFTRFARITDPITDTAALVLGRGDTVVVAFEGSNSGTDWKGNLDVMLPAGPGPHTHPGFSKALASVWPQIRSAIADEVVMFTGHSLGGALAMLAAADHAQSGGAVSGVYTFGAPKPGNEAFAARYDQALGEHTFLHINDRDVVPRVPAAFMGYHEVGRERRVFDGDGRLHLQAIDPPSAKPRPARAHAHAPAQAQAQLVMPDVAAQERDLALAAAAMRMDAGAETPLHPGAAHSLAPWENLEPIADHARANYTQLSARAWVESRLGA